MPAARSAVQPPRRGPRRSPPISSRTCPARTRFTFDEEGSAPPAPTLSEVIYAMGCIAELVWLFIDHVLIAVVKFVADLCKTEPACLVVTIAGCVAIAGLVSWWLFAK